MSDTATVESSWRDWTAADKKKQARRTCSVAGCKAEPARVKTTITTKDSKVTERRHVYCALHTPADA